MRAISKVSLVPAREAVSRLVHQSVLDLTGIDSLQDPDTLVETEEIITHTFSAKGGKGLLTVRNDGIRLIIEAWYENRKVLLCALRDRQLDGTDLSSPLTFFPNHDPACNRLPAPDFLAGELSIYSWNPSTYLPDLDREGSPDHFIADPDHYIWRHFEPELFHSLWQEAYQSGRGPWQSALPMREVPRFFVESAITLLQELGYHRVDAVPSWFNVARFFNSLGFRCTYGEHELIYRGLGEELEKLGTRLSRSQEAWLVALQNIPELSIPDQLRLCARWPVTHTNTYWVRMHRDLNQYRAEPRQFGSKH